MKFENLLSSGYNFSKNEYSEELGYILFNSMLLFNLLLLVSATVLRLYESNYYQALFDTFYIIVSVAAFVVARLSRAYFVMTFYMLVLVSYLLITFSFARGNNPVGGIGWYFILLMTVVFIRGYKEGMVFFLISVFTVMGAGIYAGYSLVQNFIGIMPFVVAYFFIRFYEKRNTSFRNIIEAQKNLYAYQARHDKLTNMPNREFFFEQFDRILEAKQSCEERMAILFIDIDNFKAVNDTYGHQVGDEVLIETSRRLKVELSEGDLLARFGGDEFVILVKDMESLEGMLSRFSATMQEPIVTQAKALTVTFSMGVALCPDHGNTETELLGYADEAMYKEKKEKQRSLS